MKPSKNKTLLLTLTLFISIIRLFSIDLLIMKPIKNIEEVAKFIIPEQQLLKIYDSQGTIINFAYAKDSGNLVVIEEFNEQFLLQYYNHNLDLLWQKSLKKTNNGALVFISDNGKTIILNRTSEFEEEISATQISSWDEKGNLLGELNNTKMQFEVSASGNYVFIRHYGYDYESFSFTYRVHDIDVYDRNLKKIILHGFKNDEGIVAYKIYSDSLLVCLKQYPYEKNKYNLCSENYTYFEIYSLNKSNLSFQNKISLQGIPIDMSNHFFQEYSPEEINSLIVDRNGQIIYDHKGNLIMKYSEPYLAISKNKIIAFSEKTYKSKLPEIDSEINKGIPISFVGQGSVSIKNNNIIWQENKYYPYDDIYTYLIDVFGEKHRIGSFLFNAFNSTIFINGKSIKMYGAVK